MPESQFKWYDLVRGEDDLCQGDLINKCPVIIPPTDMSQDTEVEAELYNVIIMSQSCDLKYKKVKYVLVCPYIMYEKLCEDEPSYRGSDLKESLLNDFLPGYHLLERCNIEGHEFGHVIVDFRNVFGIDFDFLYGYAQKNLPRLRLLPPYRERLAQAFARFFMRVGLPVEIEGFL